MCLNVFLTNNVHTDRYFFLFATYFVCVCVFSEYQKPIITGCALLRFFIPFHQLSLTGVTIAIKIQLYHTDTQHFYFFHPHSLSLSLSPSLPLSLFFIFIQVMPEFRLRRAKKEKGGGGQKRRHTLHTDSEMSHQLQEAAKIFNEQTEIILGPNEIVRESNRLKYFYCVAIISWQYYLMC